MEPLRYLVLAPTDPFPPWDGVAIRLQEFLRRLDGEIDVLSFGSVEGARPLPEPLAGRIRVVARPPYPARPRLVQFLWGRPTTLAAFVSDRYRGAVDEALARRPHLVLAVGLQMAQYLERVPAGIPRVLDDYNVEWRILDRLSATRSGLRRLYWAREAAKLRREEARLLRAAEVVLATSEVDRAGFREIAPGHRVEVVGPSIPVSRDAARRRPPAGPPCFVFTGAFDWHVNQAAALWLCREALPRLRERLRAFRVHLVGKEPSVTVRELAAIPEVTVTGAVPDVRPHLLAATAAIVPLQYGSGVRYKILEACAAGTPVVSTSCGCEGLGMESERHLLVADGADLFARACARLATDGELWSRLSAAGTGFVRETNEASARAFAAVIGGLVGARNLGAPQPLSLSMGSST